MHRATSLLAKLNAAPLHLRLLIGFGLVLVLCAAQSIFAYRTAADNVAADEAQHRIEEIAAYAGETRTALLQMEAGYRGYLLTGDEGLLASYRAAALTFRADLAETVSRDEADEVVRWQLLERRVAVWQSDIIEPGLARRKLAMMAGPDTSGIGAAALSQQDIDGIQRLLDDAIADEQAAMFESQATAVDANHRLMAVLLWGTLAVLGVGMAVAGFAATHLARAIAQVHAGERRYRQMFANNPAVKLLLDASSGAIVEANQAACDFYEYPRAFLLRLSISDISGLPSGEVTDNLMSIASGLRSSFVSRHRLASGELREVEVEASRVDDVSGRVLVYCIIHDVTERKLAETALGASEERNRLALQAARVGTWDVDFVKEAHTWSVETEALFGLAPGTFGEPSRRSGTWSIPTIGRPSRSRTARRKRSTVIPSRRTERSGQTTPSTGSKKDAARCSTTTARWCA